MTDFAPAGFNANSVIGPHEGLRVTFAQTRSMFTPDFVEAADFRQNIAHLVSTMGNGGFALAPASDVTVAPGELAVTIDFAVVGNGSLTVAAAMAQLMDALYGPLDFARRTYIRRVQRLGASTWGDPIPEDVPDTERSPWAWVPWAVGAAVVALLLVYAPEVKLGAKALRGARGHA